MKFSLRLGDGRHLTRENAWACCTTNFAFPGSGSLLAGRRVGYLQLVLTLTGFTLTTWFGLKFTVWGIRHLSELLHPTGDPFDNMLTIWHECRWALAGLGLFGVSWIWAFLTSMGILRAARAQAAPGTKPPIIR